MLLLVHAQRLSTAAAGLPQCCAAGMIQEHGKAFLSSTQTGACGELKFPGSAQCLTPQKPDDSKHGPVYTQEGMYDQKPYHNLCNSPYHVRSRHHGTEYKRSSGL